MSFSCEQVQVWKPGKRAHIIFGLRSTVRYGFQEGSRLHTPLEFAKENCPPPPPPRSQLRYPTSRAVKTALYTGRWSTVEGSVRVARGCRGRYSEGWKDKYSPLPLLTAASPQIDVLQVDFYKFSPLISSQRAKRASSRSCSDRASEEERKSSLQNQLGFLRKGRDYFWFFCVCAFPRPHLIKASHKSRRAVKIAVRTKRRTIGVYGVRVTKVAENTKHEASRLDILNEIATSFDQ